MIGTNRIERRVAALGGHGFHVPHPQGDRLIDKEDIEIFAPFIHETDVRENIEESGFLSARPFPDSGSGPEISGF